MSKSLSSYFGDIINLDVLDECSAYGLRIEVLGNNASGVMNGVVTVNFTQSTHRYVQTNMSKVNIKTISDTNGANVPGVYVHVFNNATGTSIVNLTTLSDGYAYGRNHNISFWFYQGVYNFTLEFFENENWLF